MRFRFGHLREMDRACSSILLSTENCVKIFRRMPRLILFGILRYLFGALLCSDLSWAEEPCAKQALENVTLAANLGEIQKITRLSLALTEQAPPIRNPVPLACMEHLKSAIKNGLGLVRSSSEDAELSAINQIIGKAEDSEDIYSRTSSQRNRSEGLSLKRTYKTSGKNGSAIELSVDYALTAISDVENGDQLALEITATLFKNGKFSRTIDQNLNVDKACNLKVKEHSSMSFTYKGKSVSLSRVMTSADGGMEKSNKVIPKYLLDNAIKMNAMKGVNGYPNQASLDAFQDFDFTKIHFDIHLIGTSQKYDPIQKKHSEFKIYKTEFSQGNEGVGEVLIAQSSASDYAVSETRFFANMKVPQLEEQVPQNIWAKTAVTPKGERQRLRAVDFTSRDLFAPMLNISININRELNFETIPAYGELTTTQSANGVFKYSFLSRDGKNAPASNGIDEAKYTKSSAYYDYRSPNIAALVASIRARNLSSREEQAKAILQAVNESIRYDDAMLNADTIRLLSASEILEKKAGVCQHYSALYIAIARGLGIPARMVSGTFLAQKADNSIHLDAFFHAWVEISLDGKSWTPLEPQSAGSIGLPYRGYIPLRELNVYERKDGADLSVNNLSQDGALEAELMRTHPSLPPDLSPERM